MIYQQEVQRQQEERWKAANAYYNSTPQMPIQPHNRYIYGSFQPYYGAQ
jgi:hypothetical protein